MGTRLTLQLARLFKLLCFSSLTLLMVSACGFHLPNQTKLSEAMPEINVVGDYHHPFYKMVINRLKAIGVKVNHESSNFTPDLKQEIPSLMLPEPNVKEVTVSVDSRAQSIEESIVVSIAATLAIPNHRPIVMQNSITRSVLNKPGQALASDVEQETLVTETYAELASQLVLRLSYLGRSSDPDEQGPMPGELVFAKDDDNQDLTYDPRQFQGLTLIEALQRQEQLDSAHGKTVSLDELNNGQQILQREKEYNLPKVKPEPLHKAPKNIY